MRRVLLFVLLLLPVVYGYIGIGVYPVKYATNISGTQVVNICVWNSGTVDAEICAEGDFTVTYPSCARNEYVKIDANTDITTCKRLSLYLSITKSGYVYLRAKSSGQVSVSPRVGIYIEYKGLQLNETNNASLPLNQPTQTTIYRNETVVITTTTTRPQTTTTEFQTTTIPQVTFERNITVNQSVPFSNQTSTEKGVWSQLVFYSIVLIVLFLIGFLVWYYVF